MHILILIFNFKNQFFYNIITRYYKTIKNIHIFRCIKEFIIIYIKSYTKKWGEEYL
jgi:hypothetical protein